MKILGIWDGHDSGAAIVEGNRILFAINEERLTRRKLEVCFPTKSITSGLQYLNLSLQNIQQIGISTYDFAKTMARIFPSLKEEYYQLRRRKKRPGKFTSFKKMMKYKLTEFGPSLPMKWISHFILKRKLNGLGFHKFRLHLLDHHLCHAAAAAFCCGFDKSLVFTLDGIGDGLSGTIYIFENGQLHRLSSISGKDSFGIFFEHVTNLLNMRELEDEGKVMALANYAYPIPDEENPLLSFFDVKDGKVKARYSSIRMYKELKKILWGFPSEQFAYMAQRSLEVKILQLAKETIKKTDIHHIALSGGVASNIKVNMLIKDLPEVEDLFVFPHMGDGGLALGAAMVANYELNGISSYELRDVYLGMDYSQQEIEEALKERRLKYKLCQNIEEEVGKLIIQNHIVLWFQGRMELGPRALGTRSILALPNSEALKDELNLKLKKRVWYQPFCPTIMEEEAPEFLLYYNGRPNRFMTVGYMVNSAVRNEIRGVIGVDGSCRPQILGNENPRYQNLLREVKKLSGKGVVLNTSYNIHGEPIVCSPTDAVETLIKTGIEYLAIGDYLVTNQLTIDN